MFDRFPIKFLTVEIRGINFFENHPNPSSITEVQSSANLVKS